MREIARHQRRRADVRASSLMPGDLAHWRPREGYIPVYAFVVSASDDGESLALALRENHETHGAADTIVRARASDATRAFDVGDDVAAFEATRDEAERGRGRARRVDTKTWPPTYAIERSDGTTFEAIGENMARGERRDEAARAMARREAETRAERAANALLEEEKRERDATAKRERTKREARESARAKRATGEAATGETATDATDEVAEAELTKAAKAKAAAKAAARARQEEVKAARAAKEKAAKREAQKARKAAERAARETEARENAPTREDEAPAAVADARANVEADEETVDVVEAVRAPASEDAGDVARASEDAGDVARASEDAATTATASIDEAKPPLTETRRRKLEKAEKKARRMAEIDAFLRAHEVAAAREEASRENADGDASNGAARRRKNKKKKKPTAAADGVAAAADGARVSHEWFAAFAVISFFAVVGGTYSFYSFVARKASDAFAS